MGDMHQMCIPLVVKFITSGEMSLNKGHLLSNKPCCLVEVACVCGVRGLITSTFSV